MKKLLLIVLFICLLPGCMEKSNILDNIEISNDSCKVVYDKDTHVGFLGDGDYFAKIECENISSSELTSNWKKLPLSESLVEITEMEQCDDKACLDFYHKYDVPSIENGYYYFLDRHTEAKDKFDDSDINNRSSWNFTLGIIDIDTNTIYYYEFDT